MIEEKTLWERSWGRGGEVRQERQEVEKEKEEEKEDREEKKEEEKKEEEKKEEEKEVNLWCYSVPERPLHRTVYKYTFTQCPPSIFIHQTIHSGEKSSSCLCSKNSKNL